MQVFLSYRHIDDKTWFQGTIPSLFYVVPVACEITLAVYGIVVGAEVGALNQRCEYIKVM